MLGTDPSAQNGAGLHCLLPAVFLDKERWNESGEIKLSEQQESINLAYLLMKLQPKSCDILSDRCGESTASVD